MKEKRSCPNCGAYLSEEDKVCYVCGEVVPVLKQPEKEDVAPVETEENYVDNAPTVDEPIDDSYDYFDEDNSEEYEDYQEYDEPTEKPRKSTAKKIAIICGICVGVVAIIAAFVR